MALRQLSTAQRDIQRLMSLSGYFRNRSILSQGTVHYCLPRNDFVASAFADLGHHPRRIFV